MTSDSTQEQPSEQADLITKLRDEMTAQITALRESFTEANNKLTEENTQLKQQNIDLQRALVRSATVPDEHNVVAPRSEQQIYTEHIQALAEQALKKVKI